MKMTRSVGFALSLFLLSGCGTPGEGTNIAEGKLCLAGNQKSVCADGLYCPQSGKMETRDGSNFFVKGTCTRLKGAGAPCTVGEGTCAPPFHCTVAQNPGETVVNVTRAGVCR